MTDTIQQLVSKPASILAADMRAGALSAVEVMGCYLAQIERRNPEINAICTQIEPEQAIALANEADSRRASGIPLGPLHGLPIAVKDLSATADIKTTLGSKIFADQVPEEDALLVTRLKAAGALVIGKTNTPEFGAGSHTFNKVFGVTRNPWDTAKTAGGSSGGAAAALASNMLPIADGSDMGGSLRNPAAFCGVVGLRPSMGRVPMWPAAMAWQSRLGTEGPMARTVNDCALLLSALAGPDRRDPLSLPEPGDYFSQTLDGNLNHTRAAWSADLGFLPIEPEVVAVCEAALPRLRDCGVTVETGCPDLRGAMDTFRVLRGSCFAQFGEPLLQKHRALMKDTVIQNIELGLSLSAVDLLRADETRTRLYQNMLQFFDNCDFLVTPTTQVMPFPVETEWVQTINGNPMEDYIEWMSICCIFSLFGLPAISVPCGFGKNGMPVGLQIIGRPGADLEVLKIAYAFETAAGLNLQMESDD